MEIKQEPEDFFINKQKFDFDHSGNSNLIVDTNNIQVCNIKTEPVDTIKQENDSYYLRQICDNIKDEINEMIDDEDVKRHLIKINDSKKLSLGRSFHRNYFKHSKLPGSIFICKLCGNLYVRDYQLHHHKFTHFVKKSRRNAIQKRNLVNKSCQTINILQMKAAIKNKLQDSFNQIKSHAAKSRSESSSIRKPRIHLPFSDLAQKKRESRIYPITFKCDMCSTTFSQKRSLSRHLLCHMGVKPFKCDVCLKNFSRKYHLDRHKLSHTGEKPFGCDICSKSFAFKERMVVHKRIHTRENIVQCDICSKFLVKDSLVRHMGIHTGKKPFKCNACSKSFLWKNNLVAHLRSHKGEKPYKCHICTKSYTQQWNLTVHMRSHTGEKPFKCDICSKPFKEKKNMVNHKRIHIGKKTIRMQYFS